MTTGKGINPSSPLPLQMSLWTICLYVEVFSETDEEGIPLFSVYTSTLIFVEAVVGTSVMQLDHEPFHEVKFVVS